MNVGIIGCGYVFDHYMTTWCKHPQLKIVGIADIDQARLNAVSKYYGLTAYANNAALLADPNVEIVVNLTSIESHYDVIKSALEAGKHVYSEKPLVTSMAEAKELVAMADARGLRLQCAPSNVLSATTQTMWKAVADDVIGDVRLVYAEFDDNPIYLMSPEHWRSRSGAPWPYRHEYEMGCTWEHVGYHLSWMCALFGPVQSVTAFSKCTLPDKSELPLNPPDTPDFSVACLDFASGVVGRVTCSIAAPYDHRMRIIGNRGMLHADTYRHYECPVYLETFSKLSMNARKARSVRTRSWLQWPFGVGGRRLPLAKSPPPGSDRLRRLDREWWNPKTLLRRFKRSELGQQDKMIGVAELADAIHGGREPFPSHAFTLHLTELTLAIQAAGTTSRSHILETTFAPMAVPLRTRSAAPNYAAFSRPGWLDDRIGRVLDRMHRH